MTIVCCNANQCIYHLKGDYCDRKVLHIDGTIHDIDEPAWCFDEKLKEGF